MISLEASTRSYHSYPQYDDMIRYHTPISISLEVKELQRGLALLEKSSARFECVCLLLEINLHRFNMRTAINLEIAQYSFPKNLQLSRTRSRYIIQQRREHDGREMDQFTLTTGLPTGNTSTAVLRAISSDLGVG